MIILLEVPKVKQNVSKRLALVIGIDDYSASPLQFPINDAKLVAKQLKSADFEVILIPNPTRGQFIQARKRFVEEINKYHESGADVTALFFFAGHAVQFDGHNYLIPAKSELLSDLNRYPNEADFIDQSIDVQLSILDHLSQSNASKVIFVLDACRVNPFKPDHRASGRPSGLSSVSAKPGGPDTFILFAAEPGRVAMDGTPNASNSPFTESFADAISQPGSSLEAVYRQVREQVRKNTSEKQRPYQEGVLFSFMFHDAPVSSGVGFGQTKILQTGWERRHYDVINDGNEFLKQFLSKRSIDDIRKAAESGDAEAQYLLGLAHNSGTGVAKDAERTAYWLRRSATRGFSRAQFAYGQRLYWGWGELTPNKKEGFEWWLVAAENGNASAMLEIGDTYLYGREGVPKQDYNQAEKYYNQALSTGHVEAETSLGYTKSS
jgi:uncharacterized protein